MSIVYVEIDPGSRGKHHSKSGCGCVKSPAKIAIVGDFKYKIPANFHCAVVIN
jgi:hypothetical protein